tara:strand:+ start:270 stop:458 length:189 start_codon:yes stop_codon:yes gene_type:complete
MKNAEDSTLVMLEVIEQEMVLMWLENEIPILLKEDEEFVETIIHSIMLEKNYWQQIMQIGEA